MPTMEPEEHRRALMRCVEELDVTRTALARARQEQERVTTERDDARRELEELGRRHAELERTHGALLSRCDEILEFAVKAEDSAASLRASKGERDLKLKVEPKREPELKLEPRISDHESKHGPKRAGSPTLSEPLETSSESEVEEVLEGPPDAPSPAAEASDSDDSIQIVSPPPIPVAARQSSVETSRRSVTVRAATSRRSARSIEPRGASPLSRLLSPDKEINASAPESEPQPRKGRSARQRRRPRKVPSTDEDEDSSDDDNPVQPNDTDNSEEYEPPSKRRRTAPSASKKPAGKQTGVSRPQSSAAPYSIASSPSTASLASRVALFAPYAVKLKRPFPKALPRNTVTGHFGMQAMTLISIIKAANNVPPGTPRYTLWPDPAQNPALPQAVGTPGSLLCDRPDVVVADRVYSLWAKAPGGGPARWTYFGDYSLARDASLGGPEFAKLPSATRKKWAKSLLTSKKACYVRHLARIRLHKHGRQATPAALEREMEVLMNAGANAARRGLTADEVMDGLCTGVAHIGVITMRCVGYSYELMQALEQL